ncbi:T-cell surface antigen CD2 [Eleginops maclovinus]
MMKMVMKMAAVSFSLLLLCCYAFSSTDSCDMSAAVGDTVTLPLGHKLTDSESLKWTFNDSDIIFNRKSKDKIILKNEDVYQNGTLRLKSVKKSNEGTYKPEVNAANGQKVVKGLKTIRLCLLERVQKPSVTFECKSPNVVFKCMPTISKPERKFEWLKDDKVVANVKYWTKNAKEVQYHSFRCNVSNKVSFSISDALTHTCIKSFFPEKFLGLNTWIFVGIGGGVVLLLIILVIICCVRTRRKKRLRLKAVGEMRLDWATERQLQHQNAQNRPPDHPPPHHHPQQQHPAGHTGPRQHRSKRDPQQRPRVPDGHPQPSPRKAAQVPRPAEKVDEEQPPPLPQPRKKGPRTQKSV